MVVNDLFLHQNLFHHQIHYHVMLHLQIHHHYQIGYGTLFKVKKNILGYVLNNDVFHKDHVVNWKYVRTLESVAKCGKFKFCGKCGRISQWTIWSIWPITQILRTPDFKISRFEIIQILISTFVQIEWKTDSSLSFICTEYYFNNSCLMALVVQNLYRLHIGYHHRVHLHGHHRDRRHVYRHHGDQKCSEVRLISDWLFVWRLPKFEWARLHAF